MKTKIVPAALAAATMATLCACDTTNERKIDSHIGEAVTTMVRDQTLNPQAAVAPPALAPEVGDGQRLKNALDQYHKDVAGTDEGKISRPIVFEVGNK
jgi:hypothetical protein